MKFYRIIVWILLGFFIQYRPFCQNIAKIPWDQKKKKLNPTVSGDNRLLTFFSSWKLHRKPQNIQIQAVGPKNSACVTCHPNFPAGDVSGKHF